MTKFLMLSSVLAAGLMLGGCVDRAQADEKLAAACRAGVMSLLPEGVTLGEVRNKSFSPSPETVGARHVKIDVVQMDGYLEDIIPYECIFEESFGIFNTSHVASIYQVRLPDRVVGKSGNQIQGDFEEFTRLTDAIRKSLYSQ
jgi:hypothetical protein